jgi:tRNA (guanine-N7-)-methyltransferase
MDYFLKKFHDDKLREGRVTNFFLSEVIPYLESSDINTVDLEIGCGHGHWINTYSSQNRESVCLGIDIITKRISKALRKKQNLLNDNLFFLKADALEFLKYKPPTILFSNIFIFFPDPWPKKKHHKRRLIQDSFLEDLCMHTQNNCNIYFRTDHYDYFKWTLDLFEKSVYWKPVKLAWPFEHKSYFQDLLPEFSSLSVTKA